MPKLGETPISERGVDPLPPDLVAHLLDHVAGEPCDPIHALTKASEDSAMVDQVVTGSPDLGVCRVR